ncbi:hypothetical protein [Burkholderia cenocepacia]|uniref:hypothetical protein n=1 Tax=Burkholderia cenocepacia TaxID=95486 RepID=UPI00222F4A07|nr:hypothetical protein [Burkholderia cenocepacia]MCW3543125.1 hypothetical protein [Burkholderia cenocepacia]
MAQAAEPTIRVADGQIVTIVGTIEKSGNVFTLKPDEFVAYKDNQSFQTIFKISVPSESLQESMNQFNSNWKAAAECIVQIQKFGDVVCVLSSIKRHSEPYIEPAYERQARLAREAAASRTFDASTVGQIALTITNQRTPGTVIPRSKLFSILYPKLQCELPIANARNMRKAEFLYGNSMATGCWGMILSPLKDEFVSVTKYGNRDSGSIISYTKVKILADGSAQVIGPAVSADEYQKRIDDYRRATR